MLRGSFCNTNPAESVFLCKSNLCSALGHFESRFAGWQGACERSRIQPAASVVSLPSQEDPVLLQKEAGACPPQAVNVARLAGCDFDNKLGINDIQQNDKLIICCIVSVLHLRRAHPLLCPITAGNCLLFAANICFPHQPWGCFAEASGGALQDALEILGGGRFGHTHGC